MSTKLVNVSEVGAALTTDRGHHAEYGDTIEVDDPDYAEALVESKQWARPTTKAAKAADKGK